MWDLFRGSLWGCDASKDIKRIRRAHLGRDLRHPGRDNGGLTRFATEHRLTASRFTAIGALNEAVLGYFDWQSKDYQRLPIDEQVEVL